MVDQEKFKMICKYYKNTPSKSATNWKQELIQGISKKIDAKSSFMLIINPMQRLNGLPRTPLSNAIIIPTRELKKLINYINNYNEN